MWRWDQVDGTFVQEAVPQPLLSERERKRRRRAKAKGGQPVARQKQNVSDKRNKVLTRQATKDEDDRDDERDVDGGVLAPSTSSNEATALDLHAPDVIEVLDSDDENVNTNTPAMRATGFKRPQSPGVSAGPSSSKRPRNDLPFPNPFSVSTPGRVSSVMTTHCPPAPAAAASRGGGSPIKAEDGNIRIVEPTHWGPASTAIPSRGALPPIKAEEENNTVIKVEEERNSIVERPQRGGIQTPTRTAPPEPASTVNTSPAVTSYDNTISDLKHQLALRDAENVSMRIERDAALKERDAARKERVAALKERDAALKERDEANNTVKKHDKLIDRLRKERSNLLELYRNSVGDDDSGQD